MKGYYQAAFALLISGFVWADPLPTAFKPAPTRPATEANIIVEDQEVLATCDADKICVQGQLYNNGLKTAYLAKLRIEIGGIKQGHPRHVLMQKLDNGTMEPGDRQEFYLTLDRKIPLKDKKGEEKILEVGKYNFRIVPVWANSKPKPAPPKKSPKKAPNPSRKLHG